MISSPYLSSRYAYTTSSTATVRDSIRAAPIACQRCSPVVPSMRSVPTRQCSPQRPERRVRTNLLHAFRWLSKFFDSSHSYRTAYIQIVRPTIEKRPVRSPFRSVHGGARPHDVCAAGERRFELAGPGKYRQFRESMEKAEMLFGDDVNEYLAAVDNTVREFWASSCTLDNAIATGDMDAINKNGKF